MNGNIQLLREKQSYNIFLLDARVHYFRNEKS